jgi:hypothetical protein
MGVGGSRQGGESVDKCGMPLESPHAFPSIHPLTYQWTFATLGHTWGGGRGDHEESFKGSASVNKCGQVWEV